MATRTYKLAINTNGMIKTAQFNLQRALVYGILAALVAKMFGGGGWTRAGLGALGAVGGGLQMLPGLSQLFNFKVPTSSPAPAAPVKSGPTISADELLKSPSNMELFRKKREVQRAKETQKKALAQQRTTWQRLGKDRVISDRDQKKFLFSSDPVQREKLIGKYQGQGVFGGLWNDLRRWGDNLVTSAVDTVSDYVHNDPDDVTTVYKPPKK